MRRPGQVQPSMMAMNSAWSCRGQAQVVRLLVTDASNACAVIVIAGPDRGVGWQREQPGRDAVPERRRAAGLEIGATAAVESAACRR